MAIVEGKILPPEADPRIDMRDPPIFLLQANPTFAPWLPDGSWQRVPIGSAGQVLTVNADGSMGWANASGGFTSPMTTTGDMIYSNPGATPVRLPIGSNGQGLIVNTGVPVWAAIFNNPMTTAQDLIVGGAAGAPGRLAVGANGQILTVTAGAVGWQNAAAGFANPMTTLGDLIAGGAGGAAQRLGVGANAQVLTVVSGQPAWANSASGFANPMTTTGDMIFSNPNGTPVRLPIGVTSGQVLTVSGSGLPAWLNPFFVTVTVFPSGDTTGVTDQANITATWTSGSLSSGGVLQLAPGKFYVKPTSGNICLQPPAQTNTSPNNGGSPVSILGAGMSTVLFPVGAGVTGIYYHRTTGYGAQFNNPAQQAVGYLRDFCIDGTNTSGAAIGLDVGDGWGDSGGVHLHVSNFNTTGAIGVQIINRVFWTEKWRFWLDISNCTTAVLNTTNIPGTDHSHEYNYYDVVMFCNQNQQGFVVDGVNMGGSQIFLKGNMCQTTAASGAPTGNVAALTIRNTTGQNNSESRWYAGEIWMKVEFNQSPQFPTGSVAPYTVFMDGVAQGIKQCVGAINQSNLTLSAINTAEFSFSGLVTDNNLAQAFPAAPGSGNTIAPGSQPAFPGLGNIQQNYGPDAQVCISGGTVSGISVNGQATGLTTGVFFVRAGGSITVNGTVAPTNYTWVPATQSTY